MKSIPVILTTIISLAISSFGDPSSTNLVVEIIEFDCTAYPSLFNEYLEETNPKNLAKDYSPLFDKLKASELPKEFIIRHKHSLCNSPRSTHSTEINGVTFSLEIENNQSGFMNIIWEYSKKNGDLSRIQTVLLHGDTQITPLSETGSRQSANGAIVKTKKITIIKISEEITG